MAGKYYYMKVTTDRLSLPLAVAESAGELSEMVHVKKATILSQISRYKHIKDKQCPYIRVEKEN